MAQAILLKDVENLGSAGEAVDVSPGYLRNYLVPRRLAQPATKGALEDARRRREAAEKAEREQTERAAESAALLSKTVLTISHRAGEDGKLFGSVTSKEIADAIREARGLRVDRKRIKLDDPIREVGTYMVEVEMGGGESARSRPSSPSRSKPLADHESQVFGLAPSRSAAERDDPDRSGERPGLVGCLNSSSEVGLT